MYDKRDDLHYMSSSIVPRPQFDKTYYSILENDRELPLCVDVGVILPQETVYTITAIHKNPPEAHG